MPYRCLAELLEKLRQTGELVRVDAEVDPSLEVAEVTRRADGRGGPALLFGSVRGHELPVLTNLLGTEGRICRALGVDSLDEVSHRVAEALAPPEPRGWYERLQTTPGRSGLGKLAPKTARSAACQQVVRLGGDVDLGLLPALRSHPAEEQAGVTAGQVIAADPDAGLPAVGHYDLAVLDGNRLAVAWHPHDEPAAMVAKYRERDETMPVAVVLGGDPAGLLAAMAPLEGGDAFAMAGLLRGKALELVRCRTVDLAVPADAEIVLEGHVDPAEPAVDLGWLAAPGGGLQRAAHARVVRLTALSHRTNPVFPAMVAGPATDEACMVRRVLARWFLPLVRAAVPELVDYDLPEFGAVRHWLFVSIHKTYAAQARKVAAAIWGLRSLMFSKIVVVVDGEVDVGDPGQVWSAVAAHVDPGRDVWFQSGPPDPFDSAGDAGGPARRMGIDATRKLPEERGPGGPPAMDEQAADEIERLVSERWKEYGVT